MGKERDIKVYAFLLVYSAILMFFCAGSSPLIQYLSPDSSIFYVVGRSMEKGTVLYKEIADHKGFYLFLFNWLGAWLSPDNMNGLFFVEIIFAWTKLVFAYKTARLYIVKKTNALLAAMLFLAITTNFFSWNTGNLGEQFALAFWMISFYYMALYMEQNRMANSVTLHNPKVMLLHGVCSCIVLFIQANLIAMWIPFGIGLACILIKNNFISNFFKNLGALLGGVCVGFLPVLLFGIINDCITDMYYVMFKINFMYSADGRMGETVLGYIKSLFLQPSGGIILLALFGGGIACNYYKKAYFTVTFFGMFLFSILCMSVSLNANPIYYTTYLPFCFPACIALLQKIKVSGKLRVSVAGISVLILSILVNLQLVKKVFKIGESFYTYESAYQMEELIENKEDKLLVLGDSLFYNCTGTIPHIKYFTIFAGGMRYETFPYCVDEQYNSLLSGENAYVIVEYKDENYTFWRDEEKDATMREFLDKNYECAINYMKQNVHSAMYRRK